MNHVVDNSISVAGSLVVGLDRWRWREPDTSAAGCGAGRVDSPVGYWSSNGRVTVTTEGAREFQYEVRK